MQFEECENAHSFLVNFQKLVKQARFQKLQQEVITLQSYQSIVFQQELLFDVITDFLIIIDQDKKLQQSINFEKICTFIFPKSPKQYKILKSRYKFYLSPIQSQIDVILMNYQILLILKGEITLDTKILKNNLLVQNLTFNQNFESLENVSKQDLRIVLQNFVQFSKQKQELTIQLAEQQDLYEDIAYFAPLYFNYQNMVILHIRRWKLFFILICRLIDENQDMISKIVYHLFQLKDFKTLYFISPLLQFVKISFQSDDIFPLFMVPEIYSQGICDEQIQFNTFLTNQIKQITNLDDILVFLDIQIQQIPFFYFKLLIFQGQFNYQNVNFIIFKTQFYRNNLIIDYEPLDQQNIQRIVQSQCNSILSYQPQVINNNHITLLFNEKFQDIELVQNLKISDILLGLSKITKLQQSKFITFIKQQNIDIISDQQLFLLNDYHIIQSIMIFDLIYQDCNFLRQIQQQQLSFAYNIYLLQHQKIEINFRYFQSDKQFIEGSQQDKTQLPTNNLFSSIQYYSKQKDINEQSFFDDFCKLLTNLPQELSNETQQEFKLLKKKFKNLKQNQNLNLLRLLDLHFSQKIIEITDFPFDVIVIVLLSKTDFICDLSQIAELCSISFDLQIININLISKIINLIRENQFNYLYQKEYIVFQYLVFVEKVQSQDYFDEKIKLYTQIQQNQKFLPGRILQYFQLQDDNFQQICKISNCLITLQSFDHYHISLNKILNYKEKIEILVYFQLNQNDINRMNNNCIEKFNEIAAESNFDHLIDLSCQFKYTYYYSALNNNNKDFQHQIFYQFKETIKFENTQQTQEKLIQKLQILGLHSRQSSALAWRSSKYDMEVENTNFFDDYMYQQYSNDMFRLQLLRIKLIFLQATFLLSSIVKDGGNLQGFNIENFIKYQPQFIIEPLLLILKQKDNQQQIYNIGLKIQDQLDCLYTFELQCQDLRDSIQAEQQDVKIGAYFLNRQQIFMQKYDQQLNSIQVLIQQYLSQILSLQEAIKDMLQLQFCLLIKKILQIVIINEKSTQLLTLFIDSKYSKIIIKLNFGLIEMLQYIVSNPILQSNSFVKQIIKLFASNPINYCVLQDQINYYNKVHEDKVIDFLTQLINAKQDQIIYPINLFYPTNNLKILNFIKSSPKNSANLVFSVEINLEDNSKILKVIKFSRENFVEQQKLQNLFQYLNQKLSSESNLFQNVQLNTIQCIPLLKLKDQTLIQLLKRIYSFSTKDIYVGIMDFIEFTSIYDILVSSQKLKQELRQHNITIDDQNKICTFNKEQLEDFQKTLSFSYIEDYFNQTSNIKKNAIKYNFILSYVLSSIIICYFGIGDRHLDNICLLQNGQTLQIDLEHAWFQGLKSKVQEVIPFRFTKVFQYLYKDDLFKQLFIVCHNTLFSDDKLQLTILESAPNSLIKQIIKQKLNCRYQGANNILEQTDLLLAEATNLSELLKMWKGWMYWF